MEEWQNSFKGNSPEAIDIAANRLFEYIEALIKAGDQKGAEAVIDKFHSVFVRGESEPSMDKSRDSTPIV